MTFQTLSTGRLGEQLAQDFLKKNSFKILSTNFRSRFGEIDIIAQKDKVIHFVEIKTRIGVKKGYPYEAVNQRKLNHIQKTAEYYLLQTKKQTSKLTIGVISIILKEDRTIETIKYYEMY